MKSVANKLFITLIFILIIGVGFFAVIRNSPNLMDKIKVKSEVAERFEKMNPQLFVKDNKSYYSGAELQLMILKNKDSNLMLDKDVYLTSGIVFDKSMTISSQDKENPVTIYSKNNSVVITQHSDDLVFENINFYLVSEQYFISGPKNNVQQTSNKYKNVEFTNVNIVLDLNSSLVIDVDNLIMRDCVVSTKNTLQFDAAFENKLLEFKGDGANISNNLFIDQNKEYNYGIVFTGAKNVEFNNNIVVSFLRDMRGVLFLQGSESIDFSENIIQDYNYYGRDFPFGGQINEDGIQVQAPKIIQGNFGVVAFDSSNITNKKGANIFYTTHDVFEPNYTKNYLYEESLSDNIKWKDQTMKGKDSISWLNEDGELNCAKILEHISFSLCN